jgi:3-deoxy-7-phosphoheptulonate synthase
MPQNLLTDNVRISQIKPLVPPAILIEDIPASPAALKTIDKARHDIANALHGKDDRLVCIIGPCSIHDVDAARHYARRLKSAADKLKDDLIVVMRTYFEKPRTVGGWKGLVYDPELDGSHKINKGLRLSRELLAYLCELGLAPGSELLDNITPQYTADLVAWAAIGARTTESQIHRQVASGSSMPMGFKNATSGDVQGAVDGVRASAASHWFPSVTKQGVTAIFQTEGNRDGHIILRGGASGPNFDESSIDEAAEQLQKHGLSAKVMIDCSHGNSSKDHTKQGAVAQEIARQIAAGSDKIFGIMLESFLAEGRQGMEDIPSLTYGQSVTDACIGIEETEALMLELAESVRARRGSK